MEIPDGCIFYHTIDLPGLGTIPGIWDHRNTADSYLGHRSVAGKTVLEIGPASGFFTFELERRGARVVALELGEDSEWDLVPHVYVDDGALKRASQANVQAIQKAWTFAHAQLGSHAESVRGTVYEAPRLVGKVDVALFGNVLQHLRDPLLALARVAEVTTETMIVSETLWIDVAELRNAPYMYLIPRAENPEASRSWWQVSPGLVLETMKLLGFPRLRLEYHQQWHSPTGSQPRFVPHFTVTGSRITADSDGSVSAIFGDDWHDPEQHAKWRSRWSKGPRAQVQLRCSSATAVDVAFGIVGPTAGSEVRATLNGRAIWQGRTFDVCGVSLAGLALPQGDSVLELTTDGTPRSPTASDGRVLGLRLVDFAVAAV